MASSKVSGTDRRDRKPDRPAAPEQSRVRIVVAAESVFAERGFAGGTLREVAARAGVPLSLITYHFSGKLGLYRAVFEARLPEIAQQRLAGLALADLEQDPDRRLELSIKALLVPMLGLRATEDGRRFAVLLAREIADPSSRGRGVAQELMRPVTSGFFSRLEAVLPAGDRPSALWAYGAMIGAMLYVMGGGGRMPEATDGVVDPDDVRTATEQLSAIALAGFRR